MASISQKKKKKKTLVLLQIDTFSQLSIYFNIFLTKSLKQKEKENEKKGILLQLSN